MFTLYDLEAEQIILGSLFYDHNLYIQISEILKPEDFYSDVHKIIYEVIIEENEKNQTADLSLIIANLKARKMLDKVGNRKVLSDIASMNSPVSAVFYAKKINDFALRRKLLENLKVVETSITDTEVDVKQILYDTEKAMDVIAHRMQISDILHVREIKDDLLNYLKSLQEGGTDVVGLSTNFKALDNVLSGFKPGQLIILAARPGVGKTTFALNVLQNIAIQHKESVLFFSLEMTRLELLLRMICSSAYLNATDIQKGNITPKDVEKIVYTMEELSNSDMYIDDSALLSTHDFKFKVRQLGNKLRRNNKKLGLLVVDYLQLMRDTSPSKEGRQREVANISREMKLIAKELNVPVLALSQMNRSIEQRGRDTRPQLSDLRESGAIEQDADVVMFIHREDMFQKEVDPAKENIAEIIVAKNRTGPVGSCELYFQKTRNLFTDITIEIDPSYHSTSDESPSTMDFLSP